MAEPYRPAPLDRAESAVRALASLSHLVGQAADLDMVGRDGLAELLDLVTREIDQACRDLRR